MNVARTAALGIAAHKIDCETLKTRWATAERRQAAGKKTTRGGVKIPKWFAKFEDRYAECMGLEAQDTGVLETLEDLDGQAEEAEQDLEQSMADSKAATMKVVVGLVVVTVVVAIGLVGWSYARG